MHVLDDGPLYSIVTVCLNDKDGLMRTRESLLAQTDSDYEWIVIDGASTDGTREFLQGLPGAECRWISESDKGLYDAMNKGIEMAKGQYLLFLNSGDELASSDVLGVVRSMLSKERLPDFIYGDSLERIRGDLVRKPARHHDYVWYGMFTHHQAMFYRRKFLGTTRYRAGEYPIAADYALTSEVLLKGPSVMKLSIPICVFEGGGITSRFSSHMRGVREQWRVGRRIFGRGVFWCSQVAALHLIKHASLRLMPGVHRYLRNRIMNG